MLSFKKFFEQSEEDKDILNTLNKLPRSHAALVKGYRFKFQDGNTLQGDKENIGYVDPKRKEIVVAAPWNYGREFTVLHEIGHQIYDRLPRELRKKWEMIVQQTKDRQKQLAGYKGQSTDAIDQAPDELFCMAYAQYYSGSGLLKYDNNIWSQFIEDLPK